MRYAILVSATLLAASVAGPEPAGKSVQDQRVAADSRPSDPELTKARGLLDRFSFDEAEAAAKEYIAHHPQSSAGHFLLGLIYFRRVQSQARSFGTYSSPGELPSTLPQSSSRNELLQASLASFTEGAKFGRPSSFDLKIVALDYILLADYPSAAKWLAVAVQSDPSDAESWYYLGRTKYHENRFEEAIDAFQKSLGLRPRFVLAADNLGLAYAGLGRTAEAISALKDAISWQEDSPHKTPEPYIDLGDIYSQQGSFNEAFLVLQQAVSIDGRNIRAHEMLGKVYLNLNKLAEAQKELETAVSLDPDRATLHYVLGQVYRKQGQLEKAKSEMELFQTLKAKEPPAKTGMQ